MSDPGELRWHPTDDDPACKAGRDFMNRLEMIQIPPAFVWLVRQAFWCGIRWARENRSLPVIGKIVDGGNVEWKGDSDGTL